MADPIKPLEGIILPEVEPGGLVAVSPVHLQSLFTQPDIIGALVDHVSALAKADFVPDTTTDKGRKAIASQAFKVAKTKTYLDDLGKDLVAEMKKLPGQVDAARKMMRDRLDALKDEIRKPLTDWEARVEALRRRITDIQNLPGALMTANASAARIKEAIERLEETDTTEASFQELAAEATSTRTLTLAALAQQYEDRAKWEHDQAELKRLHEEEAQRKEEERKEQLRREGEERARLALEQQKAIIQANAEAKQAEAAPAPVPTMAHDDATLPPAPAPAPTPLPAPVGAAPAPAPDDVEHRRAFNREALADIRSAVLVRASVEVDEIAEAVLVAIVKRQVRHIGITY